MAWKIRITDEAKKDYRKIENSVRKQVLLRYQKRRCRALMGMVNLLGIRETII
ncbi:UNVERIFIED_CONTAM: hypothetical protein C7383_103158 [Murimonas intestini]|uniref:Type II toxin-antitoxin system RelE/ParE family toxin n=1 Tax=Murimonas intestini TaxID=1337051 RepID=A0AB73T7F6_9FIRM